MGWYLVNSIVQLLWVLNSTLQLLRHLKLLQKGMCNKLAECPSSYTVLYGF